MFALLVGGHIESAAATSLPCPVPITTSPDGTTVHASPCAHEIVVTSLQVRTIYGGEGNNVIYAGPNVETIYGEGGDDVIYAGPEVKLVSGGLGADVIYGEPSEAETGVRGMPQGEVAGASAVRRHWTRRFARQARRSLSGPAATISNTINCHASEYCYGGDGSQILVGDEGNDTIFGERGNDEIYGNGGADTIYGGTGDDKAWGGSGADFVAGGPGADEIRGEGGNDLVRGDGTIDKIYGDEGTDTLSFSTAVTPGFTGAYPGSVPSVEGFPIEESGENRGVYVRLDGASTTCGSYPACNNGAELGGGDDEIGVSEIENVIGSPFADIIVGSSGANKIFGGGGGDVILGDGGGDELYGGGDGDYIASNGVGAAYGGKGHDNCVELGSTAECEGTAAKVEQHEAATMSAGVMMAKNPSDSHDAAYLVGSEGDDEVNISLSGGTITFTSYGATHFGGESEGCTYSEESKTAKCSLPEGASSFDAVLLAGMKGNDGLNVVGGGIELITSPTLLGGQGNDSLTGSGTTEDVLVDGNGAGNDVLKGYNYDDWLLNNEGQDTIEGGNGNDLFVSSTTCGGDTLNGGETGNPDGEATNNASWAKLSSSVGSVTADLEAQKSGNYWNEGSKEPGCTSGSIDHLYGMDDLEGSNQGDALFGDSNGNSLLGHNGEDYLYSRAGKDLILAQDGKKDTVIGGGDSGDECRADWGLDSVSGCQSFSTETFLSVDSVVNGQPGNVSVSGHVNVVGPEGGPINGQYVNVNFNKEEGGKWVYKNTAQRTLSNGYYEVKNWGVSVGNWRVRAVFPQQSYYLSSESAYHYFTIKK
jgi:Ca2+-binding RTX toxin-like protein